MPAKPLVSVVTIFLNAEKYLQEAVESVLAQSCVDWELLLVDDGSTDGSTPLALQYAEGLPGKIRYFDHPGHRNLGKSISRNRGIREAAGRYLVFLDADDKLLPQKLERQVAILNSHPQVTMVYGRALYWYSWTGNPRDEKRDFPSKLGVRPGTLFDPPRLMARFLLDGGMVPCLCSPLIRRGIVAELGGFDESIPHLYEDQVLLAKVCLQGRVLVIGDIGERYRQHPESSSYLATVRGEYDPLRPNPARLAFLDWLSGYLLEKGIENPSLMHALHKAYRPYRYPRIYQLAGRVQSIFYRVKGRLPS